MLIDSFAPKPDAAETHRIAIDAPTDLVYRALWNADVGNSLVIKSLMGLRSLPEFVLRRRHLPARNQKISLQTLIDSGFGLLIEEPGREIVLGVTGKFWRPTGNLLPFDRDSFNHPVPPDVARAVWNFSLDEIARGHTLLSTQTRVNCGDDASRRKFLAYWFFVRPFSGLIRRVMLKAVKRACETRP